MLALFVKKKKQKKKKKKKFIWLNTITMKGPSSDDVASTKDPQFFRGVELFCSSRSLKIDVFDYPTVV